VIGRSPARKEVEDLCQCGGVKVVNAVHLAARSFPGRENWRPNGSYAIGRGNGDGRFGSRVIINAGAVIEHDCAGNNQPTSS
jgi:hypothetical protein